jgi:hypothetical protein
MVSQASFAAVTSRLLVRKGLAAPSLLGSEEQLYWESEQKILPGGLPTVPRKIVLPNLPQRQDQEHAADAKSGEPVVPLWPASSKTEEPMIPPRAAEEQPRVVGLRKTDKPAPVLASRVVEEHDLEVWEDEDEWSVVAVPTPAEARKPVESLRRAKTRDDDAPTQPPATPRTATAATPPLPPDAGAKPHKMMITLMPGEFERLGIAAVKKGVTRHQIIRHALDLHMAELTREYGGCGCMANGGSCADDCGTD